MLALFGNLSPFELLVILVVAVLVFGGRLPEAAGRTFAQLRRWRRMLEDVRRESGIDRELYELRRTLDEPARTLSQVSREAGSSGPRGIRPPFRPDEDPGDEPETEERSAGTAGEPGRGDAATGDAVGEAGTGSEPEKPTGSG